MVTFEYNKNITTVIVIVKNLERILHKDYNDTKKFICFCNMRNISQKILKINLVSKKTQNTKVILK